MSTPSRRLALQAGAALVALPVLESLGQSRFAAAAVEAPASPAVVAQEKTAQHQAGAAQAGPPKRLVFLSFGWGVTEESWYPRIDQPGAEYDLPAGLAPLARHRADFSIVQNLWNKFANEGHWGSTFWLTGANRYAQPGQSFHNSISADQVAAETLGQGTRFSSLALNGGSVGLGGDGHGPGLSLAWDARGNPVGGLNGALEIYHRLFSQDGTPLSQQQERLAQRRSVLDAVRENAAELKKGLNAADTAKLEEYFQGIRDIERRLSKDEQWLGVPPPQAPLKEPAKGAEGKDDIRLIYDLIVAALQTDSTRVLTFRQPVRTLLTSLDIRVHQHDMSHYHGVRGEKLDASQRRDLAQSELLAGLFDKLKATQEADGSSLFDHVTVVYGSNLRTGHDLSNCPTLIAGRGAGFKLGQNIVAPKNTPLCNLWLALLQQAGVAAERHGDSTGPLKEVLA